MNLIQRLTGTAALVAVLALGTSADAGVLDGHPLAYNDGLTTWTGTAPFSVSGSGSTLSGTVDYAVFTAADFITAFGTADYTPSDDLVYTYQVISTGDAAISLNITGLGNPASNAGWFTTAVGDIVPASSGFDLSGNALWSFSPNIMTGEQSTGLAFSSPNVPDWGVDAVFNGGLSDVVAVPVPGDQEIPEPATLALLGLGAITMLRRR